MQTRFPKFYDALALHNPQLNRVTDKYISAWLHCLSIIIECHNANNLEEFLQSTVNLTGKVSVARFAPKYLAPLLLDAIQLSDLDLVKVLLPYLRRQDSFSINPLHAAVSSSFPVFQIIMSSRLRDFTVPDTRGYNFLHLAVESGDIEKLNLVIATFKRHRISLDLKTPAGNTALHLCFTHDITVDYATRLAMESALIANHANHRLLNNMPKTVKRLKEQFCAELANNILQRPTTLSRSAQPTISTSDHSIFSSTPEFSLADSYEFSFMHAVENSLVDDAKSLLTSQSELVTLASIHGFFPLHIAATRSAEMVSLLLSYNASIDGVDPYGNTALHYATQQGSLDTLAILLAHKPKLLPNNNGYFPIDVTDDLNKIWLLQTYAAQETVVENPTQPPAFSM